MRTIVESEQVSKTIDAGIKKWARLEDVHLGVTWRLARNPESGFLIDNPGGLYLLSSADDIEAEGAPRIVLLYRFNDEKIWIDDILIDE